MTTYSNALYPGEVLLPDDERRDPTGRTRLVFQGDRNLVLYRDGTALWSAQLSSYHPTDVVMQTDGNLVAYDVDRDPVWDTGTDGHPGAILIVRDEDAVVALDGRVLWSTADTVAVTPTKPKPTRPSRPSESGGGLFAWLAGLFKRQPKQQAPLPNPEVPSAPPVVETPGPASAPQVSRPTDLSGQFVLFARNPWHGDARFPKALPDRFFMAELDAVWDAMPDEADRLIREYTSLGCNHVTVGTPVDRGYHGHYPDVDWRDRPDRYAEFLHWLLSHGVEFSLFALPDHEPYFGGSNDGWRWDAIERDLTPFYARLTDLVEIRRVVSAWEQYASGAEMVRVFKYLSRVFPSATDRLWHNPVGHLSPCLGTEYQHGGMTSPEAWRAVAAAGCTGLAYQAWPLNMTIPDTDRDHLAMLDYDIRDMVRRFTGTGSPWGAAITTPDGKPLVVDYMEGTAFAMFWMTDTAQDLGPAWRRVALAAGARFALDGAPKEN